MESKNGTDVLICREGNGNTDVEEWTVDKGKGEGGEGDST